MLQITDDTYINSGNGNQKIAVFDLEIWKIFTSESGDLRPYHPLGISIAGIATTKDKPTIYYDEVGKALSKDSVRRFIRKLSNLIARGYSIFTINGTKFDYRVLAEESGYSNAKTCTRLALASYDPTLFVLTQLGYGVGLQALSKGFHLAGKHKEVSGKDIPELWRDKQVDRCYDYLFGDLIATLEVAEEVMSTDRIQWISGSGRFKSIKGPLPTVKECLAVQPVEPIGEQWSISTFTEWFEF